LAVLTNPLICHEVVKAETFGNIIVVVPTGFLAERVGGNDLLDMARQFSYGRNTELNLLL
jgi:hypothetical protein